jgi:hypothetical protein
MISFGLRDFRRVLRSNNGQRLAEAASSAGPVLTVLKRFRDPILHEAGPAGSPLFHVGTPSFSETRAEIDLTQRQALEGLGKTSGRPERWGLRLSGEHASLDPVAFVHQLATEGTALLDDLLGALCDDLGASDEPVDIPTSAATLRRLRLLTGLA